MHNLGKYLRQSQGARLIGGALLALLLVATGFVYKAQPLATYDMPLLVTSTGGTSSITLTTSGGTATTLWVRAHQPGNKWGTKALMEFQIDGGGWNDVSNANFDCEEPEESRGCIGGHYHTVRMTTPVNLTAGTYQIDFRFKTDGNEETLNFSGTGSANFVTQVRSVSRILDIELRSAGGTDLITDVLQNRDPATSPEFAIPSGYNVADSIADGKILFEANNSLVDFVGGAAISASCANCHTENTTGEGHESGYDLQYFGYTNTSVINRSVFHGLTESEGMKIAAFIRSSHTFTPPARPWTPVYQPGGSVDDESAVLWAAGAGIDAVLDDDADMASALFPNGIDDDARWSSESQINIRQIPTSIQLLDWNNWLPIIHPFDGYGKTTFENGVGNLDPWSEYQSMVTDAQGALNMGAIRDEMNALSNEIRLWKYDGPTEAITTYPARSIIWYSNHQWSVVKIWEVMHGVGHPNGNLQDDLDDIYTAPGEAPEALGWPGKQGPLFNVGPHICCPDQTAGQGPFESTGKNYFYTTAWYEIQNIVNAGNRAGSDNKSNQPMDWKYHYDHIDNDVAATGRDQWYRGMKALISMYQQLDNPNELTNLGWYYRHLNPSYPFNPLSTGNLFSNAGMSTSLRRSFAEHLTRSFLLTTLRIEAEGETWPRGTNGAVNELEPTTYTPVYKSAPNPVDPADNFWFTVVEADELGVSPALVDSLADWGESKWPLANWEQYMYCDAADPPVECGAGAPPVPTTLAVAVPNGSEQWGPGTTQGIVWTTDEQSGTVTLVLEKAGVEWYTIIAGTINDLQYNWLVPDTATAGTDYTIVISHDTEALTDESDAAFEITGDDAPRPARHMDAGDLFAVVVQPETGAAGFALTTDDIFTGKAPLTHVRTKQQGVLFYPSQDTLRVNTALDSLVVQIPYVWPDSTGTVTARPDTLFGSRFSVGGPGLFAAQDSTSEGCRLELNGHHWASVSTGYRVGCMIAGEYDVEDQSFTTTALPARVAISANPTTEVVRVWIQPGATGAWVLARTATLTDVGAYMYPMLFVWGQPREGQTLAAMPSYAMGLSSMTVEPTGAVDSTPPSAPAIAVSAGSGEQEIDISITPAEGGGIYWIYRHTATWSDSSAVTLVAKTTENPYTDTGLTHGQAYYYKVYHRDASGNLSSASNEDSATADDSVAPAAIANLNATATGPGIQLTATHSTSTDLAEVQCYRGTTTGFTRDGSTLLSVIASPTPGGSLSILDDGNLLLSAPEASTTYYYNCESHDEAGNETASNEDSATLSADPTPIAAPQVLLYPGNTTLTLYIEDVATSDNVTVETSTDGDSWTSQHDAAITADYGDYGKVSITSLTNDARYIVRVRAEGAGLTSSKYVLIDARPRAPTYLVDGHAQLVDFPSLFKLRTAFSGTLMQVVRTSDGVTADLALDGDYITPESAITNRSDAGPDTDLGTFGAGTNVRINTYTSQLASGFNWAKTGALGPLLVEGGLLIAHRDRGLPYIKLDGNALRASSITGLTEEFTLYTVQGRYASEPELTETTWLYANSGTATDVKLTITSTGLITAKSPTASSLSIARGQTPEEPVLQTWTTQDNEARWYLGPVLQTTKTATGGTSGNITQLTLGSDAAGTILWGGGTMEGYLATTANIRSRYDYYADAWMWPVDYGAEPHFPVVFWWQKDFVDYLEGLAAADVQVFTVKSKGAADIVVTAPTSWAGMTGNIGVGGATYAINGAVTYSAGDNTVPIADVSAISVGDEVWPRPFVTTIDGTLTDQQVADLWYQWLQDGDNDRQIHAGLLYPAGWYLDDDGGAASHQPTLDVAKLDEANASTNYEAEAEVQRTSGGSNIVTLVEIPMASLSARPSMLRVAISGITKSGTPDTNQPYIGAKLYEDETFDPATVTWTSFDTQIGGIEPVPAYDDVEGISDGETYIEFFLTERAKAAYDNGASSITLLIYNVNAEQGETATQQLVTLGTITATWYEAKGILATDRIRLSDAYDLNNAQPRSYGFGRTSGWWYDTSLPLTSSIEGNPYYQNTGLLNRGLVLDMASMTMLPWMDDSVAPLGTNYRRRDAYEQTYFVGGYVATLSDMLHYGAGDVLSGKERRAAEIAMCHMLDMTQHRYPVRVNSNLDWKVIGGAGSYYAVVDTTTTEGAYCASAAIGAAKMVMTANASFDGDWSSYSIDPDNGTTTSSGNVPEGDVGGPNAETSYFLRSWNLGYEGYSFVYGDSRWDFLGDFLQLSNDFIGYQITTDADGNSASPSGYSGRTNEGVIQGQSTPWAHITASSIDTGARWNLRNWSQNETNKRLDPDAATMKTTIAAQVAGVDDYREIDTLPVGFHQVSPWPREFPYEVPVSGWYSTLVALSNADDPGTYHPQHTTNFQTGHVALGRTGDEEWVRYAAGTGDTRYAAFVMALRHTGTYGAARPFGIESMWMAPLGTVMMTERAGGPTYDFDGESIFQVTGLDDKATPTAFSLAYPNLEPTVVWNNTTKTISSSWTVGTGTGESTRGFRDGDELNFAGGAQIDVQMSVRPITVGVEGRDGLRLGLTLDYTQAASADELTAYAVNLPIFKEIAPKQNIAQAIYWWTGSVWQTVPTNGTYVSAQHLRLSRDFGSGEEYGYVYFPGGAEPVTLEPTLTGTNYEIAVLKIGLLPVNDGSAQAVPDVNLNIDFTVTDPGLVSTGASFTSLQPASISTLPVGGYLPYRVNIAWEGVTGSSVALQYSTNYAGDEGAAAWNALGSATITSGTMGDDGTYTSYDLSVPAGATAFRFVATDTEAQTYTQVMEVAAKATTTEVTEDFTGSDDASLETLGATCYNNTIDSGAASAKITSNRAVPDTQVNSSQGGSGCYWDLTTDVMLLEATVFTGSSGSVPNVVGLSGRNRASVPQNWALRAAVRGGFDTQIRYGGTTVDSGSPVVSASTAYDLLFQVGDEYALLIVLSASTVVHTLILYHSDVEGGTNVGGITLVKSSAWVDDLTIKTWSKTP